MSLLGEQAMKPVAGRMVDRPQLVEVVPQVDDRGILSERLHVWLVDLGLGSGLRRARRQAAGEKRYGEATVNSFGRISEPRAFLRSA